MDQISHTESLFNYGDLPNEDLQPLNYYNLEEDYGSDYCISPILPALVPIPKNMNGTQYFSQGAQQDHNLISSILSDSTENLTSLQLPEASGNTSVSSENTPIKRSFPNPLDIEDVLEPLPKKQKTTSIDADYIENQTEIIPKKPKATRNRDKRNLKNKIEINGTFYKIAYRETLLTQLNITFDDIVHAVKVKLASMKGYEPEPTERRVICDRIKHEVFLHDCINICRPSTRPYIHVHVNKTCEECIKKNSSRTRAAKIQVNFYFILSELIYIYKSYKINILLKFIKI